MTAHAKVDIPGELTEYQLEELPCHFNWNICTLTPTKLKERILAVEGSIEEKEISILPQQYCLLAYLKSQKTECTQNEL